jgi:hypothetical protein
MRHSFFLFLLLANSPTVFACATCLCGDPTLTTMGVEKPFAGRTRISVDYLTRGETVGEARTQEHMIYEERVTYSISYAPTTQWMFSASVPMINKSVDRYDLSHEEGSGVGDTDLTARWFIGQPTSIATSRLWGLHLGLRVPTSSEQMLNGEAIDFDAQPGAGALIPSVGVWLGEYHLPWFFYGSAIVQHATSEGYQGYQPGNAILITAHTQYALHRQLALQFNVDARWKNQDRYSDVIDDDSGGTLVMVTPGLAWTPIEDWLVSLSYQQPILENAHGRQEEDANVRMGVTYDF